jgi:hypothetical protein
LSPEQKVNIPHAELLGEAYFGRQDRHAVSGFSADLGGITLGSEQG